MDRETLQLVLENEDFYHVIQPIVNVEKKRVLGYEFLFRSKHVQNIESFFRYAKNMEQLTNLDLKSVKKIFQSIHHEYSKMNSLYWFINIQPQTLIYPHFFKKLYEWIEEKNMNPQSIVFELNEHAKDVDLGLLKIAVDELKTQGFLIALDDVGKGESSLQTILELEPDIIKVDRYFAKDLSNSHKKQKVISTLMKLIGDDLFMIFEGIENQVDLQIIQELGVSLVQGYYLGKPQKQEYYLGALEGDKKIRGVLI